MYTFFGSQTKTEWLKGLVLHGRGRLQGVIGWGTSLWSSALGKRKN